MKTVEITTKVRLTDSEARFLTLLGKNQEIEYRDTEFMTVGDFKKSEQYKDKLHNLGWFLVRNHNGTYKTACSLYDKGLLEEVMDSWHVAFKLSDLGKKVKRLL